MPDVSKIKLPDNSEVNIKDSRISGVDNTPTSGSGNVVTSGGVYSNTVSAVGTSGNYLTVTKGGSTTNVTVPFATNATTATKLGSSTVGSNERPIYLNSGVPTAITYLHAQYLYGGLNYVGNSSKFVGINPALNYNAYAVEQGAECHFYLDGVELVRTDNNAYAKSLFNGLSSCGGQPFDMANQSTYVEYDATHSYKVGELCWYQPSGATKKMWYRCISACSGVVPTDTTKWEDVSANGTYAGVDPSMFTSFKIVVTKLPKSVTYENGLTLFWRTKGQRPNYVSVRKIDTNGNYYDVVSDFALIGPSDCIYLGSGSNTGTQNGIELTFTGFTSHNYWNLALSQIAFTGNGGSLEGAVLFRGGGSVFGNIYPYLNGGAYLGTSSYRWGYVYAQYGNYSSSITASSFVKSGGTSSQFLKADGSVDSNTYATTSQIPAAQVNADWNASSGVAQILNKPTIPSAPGTLNTNNSSAQTASSSEALSGAINLHKVSKTGSYNDLLNKPTIDSTPTSGSPNAVSSSGVYTALQALLAQMISFDSVSTNQDGTLIITLSNGDTITVDLNHNHPQYPKYVHLEDEEDMPASPESDTMYLIDGEGGGGGSSYVLPAASSSALGGIKTGYTQSGKNFPVALDSNNNAYVNVPFTSIVYLTSESAMPASPDANTLYVILES